MKKNFFTMLLFVAASTCSYAQLEVHSDGNASIGPKSPIDNTLLNLNDNYYNGFQSGIKIDVPISPGVFNIGISSNVHPASDIATGRAIGLLGAAGKTTNGYNYGVIGCLAGDKDGVGIFGTISHPTGVLIKGKYAGYFDGDTYISGTFTATDIVTPSDITLKENIQSLKTTSKGSILNSVMGMNVISYNYKPKAIPASEADTTTVKISKLPVKRQLHYGLSAQELQDILPDLVRENQDGTLGINYVELVPILIQSIQELKQELDDVKGSKLTRFANDEESAVSTSLTANKLYQNTPNPFKEQTTIRFQLADDAQNAAICIFDMSGKMLKKLPVSQGMTQIPLNGYELGEGLYLYSLMVNGREIDTKRMILSK